MSIRYPNANYPQAYDEDEMVVSGDVPVNTAALNLTVTTAGAGMGPLKVTGKDVPGTTSHGDMPQAPVEQAAEPEQVALNVEDDV